MAGEGKERTGPAESGWLAVACPGKLRRRGAGALSSPAGLTFLSLRGAAPASYPNSVPSQFIRGAYHHK
jgi:hypothetical protein